METTTTIYRNCLIGGIICNICKYPVNLMPDTNVAKEISRHEEKNKNHPSKTKLEQRQQIGRDFELFCGNLAHCIVKEYPNQHEARSVVLQYMEPLSRYRYCTECKIVVADQYKHKGKRHLTFCHQHANGYMSRYWTVKEPKILDEIFDPFLPINYCFSFRKAMEAEFDNQRKIAPNGGDDIGTLRHILTEQRALVKAHQETVRLEVVDIRKCPNLWVHRTQWFNYLNNYDATKIYQFINTQVNKILETTIQDHIKQMVLDLRMIPSTHQMFFEVERRSGSPHLEPNKPFSLVQNSTYDRYISELIRPIRIIFKIYGHQNTLTDTTYPVVQFTDRQKLAMDSVLMASPHTIQATTELLLSLVDQEYRVSPYECALICALAYDSISETLQYKSAHTFACNFSAFMGIYKVLILYVSLTAAQEESIMETIKDLVIKCINHPNSHCRYPSPMSWMIKLYNYAKEITVNTSKEGSIDWMDDTMLFDRIRLPMTDFKLAILTKIQNLTDLLCSLCNVMRKEDLPTIPWDITHDDMDNTTTHYSFLNDTRNEYYLKHAGTFYGRMMSSSSSSLIVDGAISKEAVRTYKQLISTFLQTLLCLVHISGGQPARGSEICILQHTNGKDSIRNIYVRDELVCIYTTYHKSMVKSNQEKIIYRFLPTLSIPPSRTALYFVPVRM